MGGLTVGFADLSEGKVGWKVGWVFALWSFVGDKGGKKWEFFSL